MNHQLKQSFGLRLKPMFFGFAISAIITMIPIRCDAPACMPHGSVGTVPTHFIPPLVDCSAQANPGLELNLDWALFENHSAGSVCD
jgi:hypothetical protein